MFTVRTFPAAELGNTSFLVADPEGGVAAVIDPYRDVDGYLTHAEKHNLHVTRALDTHVHNDFVSGGRELAAEAGTDIGELAAGAEVDLGALKIRALHTPGHTPEHKSYLLLEGDRLRVLFSGGAVMVGSIARTDLFGPHLAMHLAIEALSTLQVRLRGLPDDIAVYPTHGGGSFCGIGAGQGSETTLGRERATNPFFQATEVMPFLARALDQHRYPDYYRDMAALNRAGMPLLGRKPTAPAKLSPDQVANLMSGGEAVVDIRPGIDYDRGHIPGSYSVGLEGGSFSAWVGWLIARDRGILLAGGSDAQHAEALRQLHRIGFDRVSGALDGGMDAWASSGRQLSTFETADIEDLGTWIISGEVMTVLDARDDHEWADGHVPGAVHMYVPDIPHHASEIPADAPVAVHCGVGYRAGIAASLLEQAGLKRIIHVNAPYEDWAGRLHLAETVPH